MIKDPNTKTQVVHSRTKSTWNVIGVESWCSKYKIARIPYITGVNDVLDSKNRLEALEHAEFISYCFNNSKEILAKGKQ